MERIPSHARRSSLPPAVNATLSRRLRAPLYGRLAGAGPLARRLASPFERGRENGAGSRELVSALLVPRASPRIGQIVALYAVLRGIGASALRLACRIRRGLRAGARYARGGTHVRSEHAFGRDTNTRSHEQVFGPNRRSIERASIDRAAPFTYAGPVRNFRLRLESSYPNF